MPAMVRRGDIAIVLAKMNAVGVGLHRGTDVVIDDEQSIAPGMQTRKRLRLQKARRRIREPRAASTDQRPRQPPRRDRTDRMYR